MLTVYIAISDFDPNALEILEKNDLDITLRQPGERPSEKELIEIVNKYNIVITIDILYFTGGGRL